MANRLKDMVIDFVSLVPRGANQHADIVLAKRDDTGDSDLSKREFSTSKREAMAEKGTAMPDGSFPIANKGDLKNAISAYGRAKNPDVAKKHIIKRAKELDLGDMIPEGWADGEVEKTDPSGDSVHVDKPLGSESKSKKKKSDEEQDVMDEDLDMDEEDDGEEPDSKRKMSKELATTGDWSSSTLTGMADNTGLPEGLTPEAVAYIEKLEDLVLQKEDELSSLLANSPDELSKEDIVFDTDLDEIAKNDPTVAALIAKADAAEARAQEAEAIAKAERETRITSEMIAKAQGYSHLGSVEDVAAVLKGLHDTDMELFEAVDSLLAKAEASIAESSLFSEIGKSTEPGVGADLDSVAKSLRAEDPTLTAAQAVAKALELNPDLYNLGGN